ncbi:TetR/AcrR family transcriptional regulator [Demequina sp. NBRC 110054]|uniref:TetR/AcrR family transcriptional regulator n=1 Tax=Demequina sp. NBRC 110054 TaxID=1570343 RepID=UPI0013566625|nr:TetR/AcrR family transcriptional regulator [Demequina sp. NBRC 110054]
MTATQPATRDVRSAILAAATALFEQHGPDGLSMRQIAREIGYSATTIYLHFRDKDDLMQAVCTSGFAEFGAQMEAAGQGPEPFAERLRAVGLAYVDFAFARPMHYDVMFVRPKEWTLPDGGEDPSFLGMVAMMEAAQASGEIRPGSAREQAAGVWSALHGVVSLALAMHGSVDILEPQAVRARAAHAVELHLADLTAPPLT